MAAIATPVSARVNLSLSAGTDPDTGKTITKNVSLSNIDVDSTADQIYSVATLAGPCLQYPVGNIRKTVVSDIAPE